MGCQSSLGETKKLFVENILLTKQGQRMINAMAPLLLFIFLSTLKLEHTTLNWWKKHPAPCFSALSSICMRKERTPRYWTTSSCSKGLPNSLQDPFFKANWYLLAIDKSSSNDFVITIETKSKSVFRSLPIYQKIAERLEISARMILTKPNFMIFKPYRTLGSGSMWFPLSTQPSTQNGTCTKRCPGLPPRDPAWPAPGIRNSIKLRTPAGMPRWWKQKSSAKSLRKNGKLVALTLGHMSHIMYKKRPFERIHWGVSGSFRISEWGIEKSFDS